MLTNPYAAYPGFPMSPYQDFEYFNINIQNLYTNIIEQKNAIKANKHKILFHLTCGTAAEELFFELRPDIGRQWQQLFPEHLQTALKNKQEIVHFIVCPSRTFNNTPEHNYVPLFITQTQEFNWNKLANNIYKSSVYNITVKIFNCPMPSECDYTEIIKKLKLRSMCDEEYYTKINQTHTDRNFIGCFYNELNKLFNRVTQHGGFVTCFSFAVFNNDSDKRIYNNYYMFKEIKNLFVDKFNKCNKLLAEWVYIMDYYNVIIYNYEYDIHRSVCFIDLSDNLESSQNITYLDLSSNNMHMASYKDKMSKQESTKLYIVLLSRMSHFNKDIINTHDIKQEIIKLKQRVWELLNEYYGTKKLLEHLNEQKYFAETPNADVIEKFKEYITQINNNNNITYDKYELNALSLIFMTNIKIIDDTYNTVCYIDNKFDNIVTLELNLKNIFSANKKQNN